MNKIILLGRLVKEAEVKYTESGKVVATFTLAVDRPFAGQNGKREADFINCQLWGKSAETLGNTVTKGQRVLVDGRLQIRKYTDKSGADRWITEVVCNNFEYIERKGEAASAGGNPTARQQSQGGFSGAFGQEVPMNEEIPF